MYPVLGLLGVFLLLAAVAAMALMPGWVVQPPAHRNPAGAVALVLSGVVALAFAEMMRRVAAVSSLGGLTLVVGPDEIGFERHGEMVDRIGRPEVGVVVMEEFGRAGVQAFEVRGPAGDQVGRWDTDWICKGSLRPWLALRRHGWPRVRYSSGRMGQISKDAPRWARDGG